METSAPRAGSQLAAMTARHSASYRAETLRVSSRDELAEMAASSQGNFEGKFESLDLAEFAKKQPWWRKLFGQESGPSAEKYSVATQLLIGGVTGWCTGFIFQKVGKLAATAVGGGFFLLQLANHTGYIKVDWQRVEKDMKKAKEQLKIRKSNQISTEVKSKAEEALWWGGKSGKKCSPWHLEGHFTLNYWKCNRLVSGTDPSAAYPEN
ncbi:FUN14 domain-containing protein 2 isoform X1 [Ursus americanus]|uniref:FUN14 domain-containing protein 2 n=2 Tax=Ursus TaxID=9639 RepID=A0A8M1FGI9_URSMA|nr:FUN14 domain-containing protein 2 isoform X1 [Ursus maritimus]XP_045644926.1 FUN14 domain-containing protein 2 isoform X1 [Ursus americanus]